MFIAKNEDLIILAKDNKEELEKAIQFMVYTSIEETEIEYKLYDGMYLTEEEIQVKEHEHIQGLTCTKRVFALMLQELGITYGQLKTLIASNEQAELEWETASTLLRSNPLLDIFGEKLGISSKQIDILFQVANGELSADDFELYKKKEVVDENTTDTTTNDISDEVE